MVNYDEYNNKVFEQFKDKYKDFKTSFAILLGFAVVFFFIILLPNFSLLYEKNNLSLKIYQTQQDINMLEVAGNKTIELGNNISKFKDNLRNYILSSSIDVSALNYESIKKREICTGNSIQKDSKLEECKIINQILINLNLHSIITPISNISEESSRSIHASGLIFGLTNLSKQLNDIIFDNLYLIRTIGGKGELGKTLSSEIEKKLNKTVIEKLNTILIKKNNTLTETIKQIEESEKIVKERVSKVETPIGQLPITLQEAISIFPFSLGIGSLISTSLLLECLKLRDNVRNYYNRQGLSDNEIANIASPWIDTIESKINRKIKFLILTIPFIIFIVSSILIIYEWFLLNKIDEITNIIWTFPGGRDINHLVFAVSYIVSLIFFIYGYRKLIVYL